MNKTGRPTTDKKEQAIKLRMNDAMRAWVERMASAEGVSMSEFIRGILREAMDAPVITSGVPRNATDRL